MEKLVYVDRRNTNCNKWDGQQKMFGEEGLHAMWVADMDFRVPECVVSALREYVESGVYGYYKIPDAYYQAFIDWEREHHGYEVKKEWIRFSPWISNRRKSDSRFLVSSSRWKPESFSLRA